MTPQEALNILGNAAAQVQAVLAFHEQTVTARQVLQEFLNLNYVLPETGVLQDEGKTEGIPQTDEGEVAE